MAQISLTKDDLCSVHDKSAINLGPTINQYMLFDTVFSQEMRAGLIFPPKEISPGVFLLRNTMAVASVRFGVAGST